MTRCRRQSLVEAIGSKTNQLTVDVDRVTSDALRAIETRGQAFSQSMLSHGTEVARTISSFWAPAAFTFVVMHWGDTGWLAIAAFVVAASFGLHPSARAADRFAADHFTGPKRRAAAGRRPAACHPCALGLPSCHGIAGTRRDSYLRP